MASARAISNDSIVLEGSCLSGGGRTAPFKSPRPMPRQGRETCFRIGSSQQVMLEVRFSEIKRSALKQFGPAGSVTGGGSNNFGCDRRRRLPKSRRP
jgi:pilus assembly protein CpaC